MGYGRKKKVSKEVKDSTVSTSSINFGINPGFVVNQFQPSDSQFSQLVAKNGKLNLTNNYDSKARIKFDNMVFQSYFAFMQREINYNLTLSKSDFKSYFNVVSSALQIYYTLDSVIAYTSNSRTENLGLTYMRSEISADMLNALDELRAILEQYSFPPRMLGLIYWFYQTYTFDQLPSTGVVKNNFGGIFLPGNKNNWDFNNTIDSNDWHSNPLSVEYIRKAIATLQDVNVSKVSAILNTSFPNWRIGTLPMSQSGSSLDKGFLTWWINSPMTYGAINYTTNTITPDFIPSLSNTQEFNYWSYETAVDGIIPALFYCRIDGKDELGLYKPEYNWKFEQNWIANDLRNASRFDSGLNSMVALHDYSVYAQYGMNYTFNENGVHFQYTPTGCISFKINPSYIDQSIGATIYMLWHLDETR